MSRRGRQKRATEPRQASPAASPRETSRAAEQSAGRVLRARYDSAQTNHTNQRWWANADGLSAAAANTPQVRRVLRNRSRYEFANNSYCSGMVQTLANDLIGTGPRLQMLLGDEAANDRIERAFVNWSRVIGLAEKLRTLRMAQAVSGEGFLKMHSNAALPTQIKLDLQGVESDQISTPDLTTEDERAVDGIRFDESGNPVEYHLLDHHPGSMLGGFASYRRIPAGEMIHVLRADRPGQFRGIPEITPALDMFAELRRYTRAVTLAAEIAAEHPLVIYSNAPHIEPDDIDAMDVIHLARAAATTLPKGWQLGQMKAEQPTTTYGDFKRELLNEIARCLNLPYNVAAGNSSSYNYASGRLDHQVYFKSLRVLQATYERVVLDRLLEAWLLEASMATDLLPPRLGLALQAREAFREYCRATPALPKHWSSREIDAAAGWLKQSGRLYAASKLRLAADEPSLLQGDSWFHQWFWDGHPHVDPAKEANAQATRLANHTTTLADEYAARGQDWRAQIRQRAIEMEFMVEKGLIPQSAGAPADAKN